MTQFLWGAEAMACVAIALLFLRFRRMSQDRLFGFFAAAFALLALHWSLLALFNIAEDSTRHYMYLLRLLAFVLIIIGIVDKNRRRSRV